MTINIISKLFVLLFVACQSPEVFDDEYVKQAIENGESSHESFKRSLDFTRAWLKKVDPESGLIPSNLDSKLDFWDPANAAAGLGALWFLWGP